jgi:hypothetical protein
MEAQNKPEFYQIDVNMSAVIVAIFSLMFLIAIIICLFQYSFWVEFMSVNRIKYLGANSKSNNTYGVVSG